MLSANPTTAPSPGHARLAPLPTLPVIVGTGLTGCAISRSLARAGIRHLLIGPPLTGSGARLGESLNLEGSLDLVALFPEFHGTYLAKTAVTAHVAGCTVRCDLNMQRGRLSAAFYRLLGYPSPPDAFLHVDRGALDPAVFAAVIADPHCTYVDARVAAVAYDRESDRITGMTLDDGRRLAPLTVFDATQHVGAVSRHLGLEIERLGCPQRAVYGHLMHADERPAAPGEPSLWHETHVVRLLAARDQIDGFAWMIPLRGEVSIGVAVDLEDRGAGALDDRALFDHAVAAIENRGILPRGAFTRPQRLRPLPRYDHFVYSRACGRNWLLAGGTFCQMWFAASAGVSSGLAAARVAPHFIGDPGRYGPIYSGILGGLRAPHAVFEWLRRIPPETEVAAIEAKADVLVAESVVRLAQSVELRPGWLRARAARGLVAAIRSGRFDASGICLRVAEAPTPAIKAEDRLAILGRLLEIFAGSRPLDQLDACLAADVEVQIDRLRFRGRAGWRAWARHSAATWPFEHLHFEIVSHRDDPARQRLEVEIVAVARRPGGPELRSPAERFAYRFEGPQIREIWTSRRNYTFLYGRKFARLPGFFAHLLRIWRWNRRHPETPPVTPPASS